LKILAADDDRISQQVLSSVLREWGHEVVLAGDGDEAWRRFTADPARMVITDWMMPGIDGLELCRRIRSEDATCYTYIILLTANREKEHIAQGLAAGADDFVAKPFEVSELEGRVMAGLRILELEDKLEHRIAQVEQARAELERINRRLEDDLRSAARAQRALLPQVAPNYAAVRCAWRFQTCDALGGDSLNLFPLPDGKLGCYVADVSGHGVQAALLAVTLHQILTPGPDQRSLLASQYAEDGEAIGPAGIAQLLNRRFQMDPRTMQYFTLVYGILDTQAGVLRYVAAGHPGPACISRSGRPLLLGSGGMPIGFHDQAEYREDAISLTPGDRICLYSDGLIERLNAAGEMFGQERLAATLANSRDRSLEAALDDLYSAVQRWARDREHEDDMSAILMEYGGGALAEGNGGKSSGKARV